MNFYQHGRLRDLEIILSCSLPFSLSLSVFPNTHHICVDSQLAHSVWTVTALGSKSSFPKIHLIDHSLLLFFSLRVECEVLHHCGLSVGWQKQPDTVAVVRLGLSWGEWVYVCIYDSLMTVQGECVCVGQLTARDEWDYTRHLNRGVCIKNCVYKFVY